MDNNNKMIKHTLHPLLGFVIKCFKGIGVFFKKRWKILVGVVAGIVFVISVGALCNYIIEDFLPQKRENKAIDIVESKLHSDNPDIKKECAYSILQKQHSDNYEEFIYCNELDPSLKNYKEVTERYNTLKKEAFDYIEKEAFAGDAGCQYVLGNLYSQDGDYVENDISKAAYWWNEAALQDYVRAYNSIGECYRDSKGVLKNQKLALEWFKKGAEAGDSNAQYNYGNLFYEGVKERIYYTLKEVVEHKNKPEYEIILPRDINQAKYWWKKAAEQGHSGALDALQKIYY